MEVIKDGNEEVKRLQCGELTGEEKSEVAHQHALPLASCRMVLIGSLLVLFSLVFLKFFLVASLQG